MSIFPKAIIHIDGDAFFASCEITRNPGWKGKPVVTGGEKGIVTSMSYEAKARGIKRTMRMFEARKVCPDVIVAPTDFMLYAMYAKRMYAIVRRYTDLVEEYSIDECFGDLTGVDIRLGLSYEEIAKKIQSELCNELNMTFSVGLSVNKSLAKLASKWKKPAGFTVIGVGDVQKYLVETPVHKLWGIGSQTSILLRRWGISTALDLASKDATWIRAHFDAHIQEMHAELNGSYVNYIDVNAHDSPASVQHTAMFPRPSRDRAYILSQISDHIEHACAKLRDRGLFAGRFSFFLKTQQFTYHGADYRLAEQSAVPGVFLEIIEKNINEFYRPNILYRSCGVRLFDLTPIEPAPMDLFAEENTKSRSMREVFSKVDDISKKYGSDTVHLASSIKSTSKMSGQKKLRIPILGIVR